MRGASRSVFQSVSRSVPFVLTLLAFSAAATGQQTGIISLEQQAKSAAATISGKIQAKGLQQPVTVIRDRWGVPHIYAANQHDLFFAQGYVQAQDRLFQMELWKRTGRGTLAEVLGPKAVQRDVYARMLRYRGDMAREYASYAPDTQQILKAFTDGINEYVRQVNAGKMPVEFQLAGFRPTEWKPEDCLNRMAAFSMTNNAKRELHNVELLNAVGSEKATALSMFDPPVELEAPAGADYSGLKEDILKELVGSDTRIEFPADETSTPHESADGTSPPHALWSDPLREPGFVGSNNWTVSGKLTATGKPMLANDPHRTIAEPSLRYVVHLVAPGWDVIGATEPGLPGVNVGHNQRIAWGFTIFGIDQQDLYLETLNADGSEYKTESGWAKLEAEQQVFHIKGAADGNITIKYTRHGPIVWQQGTRALALRWVGTEPGTAGYLAGLSVDRAKNWNEFLQAMDRWKLPSENIVYADVDGNIGEYSAGLAPIRPKVKGEQWTGLLPAPGTGGYEWSGFVSLKDHPQFFNPAEGFVATANHKMIPENYPYAVGFQWAPQDRVGRIREVLSQARDAGKKLQVSDLAALQNDVVSLPARQLVKLLREVAGGSSDPAVKLLTTWDAALTRDSAAGALYEVWVKHLKAKTKAALPGAAEAGKLFTPSTAWVVIVLSDPEAAGFGDNAAQKRNELMLSAAQEAAAELAKLQGPDPAKWAWGKMHEVKFRHPLDLYPGAAQAFDSGPIGRPGDGTTVDATAGEKFEQDAGASYREVFDLGDWDKSVGVNVPGESGQPGAAHYRDLLPLWTEGEYFPMSFSKAAVERNAKETMTLVP